MFEKDIRKPWACAGEQIKSDIVIPELFKKPDQESTELWWAPQKIRRNKDDHTQKINEYLPKSLIWGACQRAEPLGRQA